MALSVMAKTTAVSSSAMVGLDRGSHGHRTSAMAISLSSFNTTTTNNVSSISNGSRVHCMKVVNPSTNKRFETLSYLPPQTPESISKQIAYIIKNGWIPCLEFDCSGVVFRENSRIPGYYDGRYWTLWKLPMFGCNDVAPVLGEIEECKATNPKAYIRLLGFDNIKQVQCVAFLVHNPFI